MIIKTQYNVGEKVWYYIEEYNQYAWGKIERIVITCDNPGESEIGYMVNNRFYCHRFPLTYYGRDNFEYKDTLHLDEDEIFTNIEELKQWLEDESKSKMINLSEMKKGIF